jgi:hypothetical protein
MDGRMKAKRRWRCSIALVTCLFAAAAFLIPTSMWAEDSSSYYFVTNTSPPDAFPKRLAICPASVLRYDGVETTQKDWAAKRTTRYGRWLVLFLTLLLAAPAVSKNATIELSLLNSTDQAVVAVMGPFEASDIEQIRTKTSALSKAIVMVASDGGSLKACSL